MTFKFKGGSKLIKRHQIEKFLIFLVLENGKELSLYTACSLGLASQDLENKFSTQIEYVKIIMVHRGFGIQHRRKTFIFKLADSGPYVTISSFSGKEIGVFEAYGSFLPKKTAYALLSDENSKKYLLNEPILPPDTMKKIVQIHTTKEEIRCIHIKKH